VSVRHDGTVLLLGEDRDILDLLEFVIRSAGWIPMRTCAKHFGVWSSSLDHADVVVLDVPHRRAELERRLEGPARQWPPVVALTSDSSGHERRRALGSVVELYLTKPFSPRELVGWIQRRMQSRAHPDSIGLGVVRRYSDWTHGRKYIIAERACRDAYERTGASCETYSTG
jgi:DNA-binding response OmpR family regulator